jgi:hypothetical protein
MSHRMSPEDFDELLGLIRPSLEVDCAQAQHATPNGALVPEQRLSLTLQFLGGARVPQLIDIFKCGIATVYRVIWSTLRAINECKALAPVWDVTAAVRTPPPPPFFLEYVFSFFSRSSSSVINCKI